MPDALSAAAEPNRRRLLQLLARGPMTVNALAAHFSSTRPAVSQHLRVLAEAELVTAEKRGRERLYRLDREGMARLRTEMDRFWTNELDRLLDDATAVARERDRAGQIPHGEDSFRAG
jgi:DNA-binding transcriptional ArsR family regulator